MVRYHDPRADEGLPLDPFHLLKQAQTFQKLYEAAQAVPPDQADAFVSKLYLAAEQGGLSEAQTKVIEAEARKRQGPSVPQKAQRALHAMQVGNQGMKITGRSGSSGKTPVEPSQSPDGYIPYHRATPEQRRARQERRRFLAAAGWGVLIPPREGKMVTESERAVLVSVAITLMEFGLCCSYVGKLAALAGVCERTVERALAMGMKLGLIAVEYRNMGQFNLTNVIRPTDDLRQWLKMRKRLGANYRHLVTPTNLSEHVQTTLKKEGVLEKADERKEERGSAEGRLDRADQPLPKVAPPSAAGFWALEGSDQLRAWEAYEGRKLPCSTTRNGMKGRLMPHEWPPERKLA